jgi:hypothetical protein
VWATASRAPPTPKKRWRCAQQQRNLRSRGIGFDARVLQLNRDAAAALRLDLPYAEVFELARFIDGLLQPG